MTPSLEHQAIEPAYCADFNKSVRLPNRPLRMISANAFNVCFRKTDHNRLLTAKIANPAPFTRHVALTSKAVTGQPLVCVDRRGPFRNKKNHSDNECR